MIDFFAMWKKVLQQIFKRALLLKKCDTDNDGMPTRCFQCQLFNMLPYLNIVNSSEKLYIRDSSVDIDNFILRLLFSSLQSMFVMKSSYNTFIKIARCN